VTLASLRYLPETLPPVQRSTEPIWYSFKNYLELIRERRLLGLAGTCGFFFMASFAYVAGSPFVYISYYHVPPQFYGFLFGSGIVGMMTVGLLNAHLVMRWGSARLLKAGTAVAALAGAWLAADAWSGWGGLAGLAVPLFILNSMTALIVANAISAALSNFPKRAGAVSALVGAVQYGMGVLGSALVGWFSDGSPRPFGWVIALGAVGAMACAWFAVPSRNCLHPMA
jgi:DHA1 family bicyclomycin/chloramphenicol resistance-like MFS transporter